MVAKSVSIWDGERFVRDFLFSLLAAPLLLG